MRFARTAFVVALALAACRQPTPRPADSEPATFTTLLAPVHFYQSYVVGRATRTTGLQRSDDGGATWRPTTWPEQISTAVAVADDGRTVYVGCGNGVMLSRDGGNTFALSGGMRIAEVQQIAIDRRDERRVWLATAYGVFTADDARADGNPWRRIAGQGGSFRFCSDVVQDARDPERLWIGSEVGVFTSPDGGRTVRRCSNRFAVRDLLQDRRDADVWFAATDGDGLWRTADAGDSWTRLRAAPAIVDCIAQDPHDASRLVIGAHGAVLATHDDGTTFSPLAPELPTSFWVYDVAFDPNARGHVVCAGCEGILSTTDDGATWSEPALAGAIVRDVDFVSLDANCLPTPPFLGVGDPVPSGDRSAAAATDAPTTPGFDDRLGELRSTLARPIAADATRVGLWHALALARSGRADNRAWGLVRAVLEKPQHSMFFSLPATALWLHAHDSMPPSVERQLRDVLTSTPFYRGDTENHWVMHYTAQLLCAQSFASTPAEDWPAGRTSRELYAEAERWLRHWAWLSATEGQGEFDSPWYAYMFVTPMLLLADFADDPELRRLGRQMVDLLVADYLAESLEGAYCGGHSRDSGSDVTKTRNHRIAGLHWLFAGGIDRPERPNGWLAAAAWSRYRPPTVFDRIANARDEEYVHREKKRVRNVIRYGQALNPPVFKQTFMTPNYALGSLQGGLLQPIQQRTWDLTWRGSRDDSLLFSVHPYSDGYELGMFFPEDANLLEKLVDGTKKGYSSTDRLVSSSPFERVHQDRDVLLALYRFPADAEHRFADLYVPEWVEVTEHGDGWLVVRDGEFATAIHALGGREPVAVDGTVDGFARRRVRGDVIGFVVVARSRDDPDVDAFVARVVGRPTPTLDRGAGGRSTLRYDAGVDRVVELGWLAGHDVATVPPRPSPYPLFDGPWLSAPTGTGVLELTDGERTHRLDFRAFRPGAPR